MSEHTSENSITFEFNALLFIFSALVGVVLFALSERAKNLTFGGIIVVSAIDGVRYLFMMLIGSFFIKEFWRRLISNLVPVRPINYQEAIAISLMLGLLFAH